MSVSHTACSRLPFLYAGHGSRGSCCYALRVQLAAAVQPCESKWFVCGPSVRVCLQKRSAGPYWPSLTDLKLPQCKIDWQSWIDEDEATELSAAPHGFDVDKVQMMMIGESYEFYRDLDHFESSDEEGEEASSIMIDQGLNTLDSVHDKFRQLDIERPVRAAARAARRLLRRKTRQAQLADARRRRDMQAGRPAAPLSTEQEHLLAGAQTLHERLSRQKKAESLYWASMPHHLMRPESKFQDTARVKAVAVAAAALQEYTEQMGMPALSIEEKAAARKFVRAKALETAFEEVGRKDAAPIVAHEIAAAVTREVMGQTPPPPFAAAALVEAEIAAAAAGMDVSGVGRPV